VSEGPVSEIVRILDEMEDADDVLRAAVAALVADPEIVWAGICFLEGGVLVIGPCAGVQEEASRTRVPVVFDATLVGELWADGTPDRSILEDVAARIAPLVLIGWDTGGEAWEP
jgi:putative methionine-R-sulfoxide reductase with GAF domain